MELKLIKHDIDEALLTALKDLAGQPKEFWSTWTIDLQSKLSFAGKGFRVKDEPKNWVSEMEKSSS